MFWWGAINENGLFKGVVNVWRKATLRSWLADNWIWSGIGFFMIVIEVVFFLVATVYFGKVGGGVGPALPARHVFVQGCRPFRWNRRAHHRSGAIRG